MTKMQLIGEFLAPKKLVFAGLSRDPKSYSRIVMQELESKGYEIYPMNPNTDEIAGKHCLATLDAIPDDVNHLLIMTPKNATDELLVEAIGKGIKSVWVQQYSNTKNTLKIAEEKGYKNVITKKCILMYTQPKSIHKFHAGLNKLFGIYAR